MLRVCVVDCKKRTDKMINGDNRKIRSETFIRIFLSYTLYQMTLLLHMSTFRIGHSERLSLRDRKTSGQPHSWKVVLLELKAH